MRTSGKLVPRRNLSQVVLVEPALQSLGLQGNDSQCNLICCVSTETPRIGPLVYFSFSLSYNKSKEGELETDQG